MSVHKLDLVSHAPRYNFILHHSMVDKFALVIYNLFGPVLLVLFFFCPGAGLIILDELILRNSRDYLGLRQFTDEVTLSTTFQPGFFRP